MSFEEVVHAMVRLSDRYENLENDPDFLAIEDWLWRKAEADGESRVLGVEGR
jgi:hypothetical protein